MHAPISVPPHDAPEPKDVVLTWTNHRQIRLRSFLDATEEMALSLEATCANPQAGDEDYAAFIANDSVTQTAGYDWASVPQRAPRGADAAGTASPGPTRRRQETGGIAGPGASSASGIPTSAAYLAPHSALPPRATDRPVSHETTLAGDG